MMNEKTDYTRIIENYLDGELSDEELLRFNNELNTNKQLGEELQFHKDIYEAISREDEMELRRKLGNIVSEYDKRKINIPKKTLSYVLAASVAIMILAGCLYMALMPGMLADQRLFSMYYEPYEKAGNIRSASDALNDALEIGMNKYDNKNYQEAEEIFKNILVHDGKNMLVRLYAGICHLELENYDKAVESFNIIIDDGDNLFVENAEWYLALGYLKNSKTEKAKAQLEKIVTENGFYKEKSTEILKKMKTGEIR